MSCGNYRSIKEIYILDTLKAHCLQIYIKGHEDGQKDIFEDNADNYTYIDEAKFEAIFNIEIGGE
jgi:hypothetical protein